MASGSASSITFRLFGIDVTGAKTLSGLGFAAASASKELEKVGLRTLEFAGIMGAAGIAIDGVGVATTGLVGLLGAGLGLAFIGIGVKVAMMSAQVKSAMADAKKSITTELQQVAGPVNNVVADLVRGFTSNFQKLRPQLSGFFSQLAPVIQTFGTAAQGAFNVMVNGAQHALSTVTPLINQVSAHLVPIFHALGEAGHNALGVLATNAQPLGDIFTSLEKILPLLGNFVGALVNIGVNVLPVLHAQNTQIIAGFTRLATLLGNFGISIIPALAKALGDISRAFMSGLVSIVPALTAAFNGILPVLGTLSRTLFPALAQIIKAILPVITQMVQALGPALGAVLPVIGNSVAGLARSLGALVTAITPLLTNLAQLAAWITVVANNLVGALAPVLAHMIGALTPGLNDLMVRVYQLANAVGNQLGSAFHTAEPGLVALSHAVSDFLIAAGPVLDIVRTLSGILLGAAGQALNLFAQGLATIINVLRPIAPEIVLVVVAIKEWGRAQALLNIVSNANPLVRLLTVLILLVGWFTQAHGWVKVLAGAITALVAVFTVWAAVTWALNSAQVALAVQQAIANGLVIWNTVVRWANTAASIAGTVASWAATAATVAWAAATWVLNGAIAVLTSPITLVVLAIAALAAGVYLLIRNWSAVVDFLHGPWGTAISAAIAVIFPFIGIPLLIIGHWKAIVSFFQKLWSDVTAAFSAFSHFLHGPWATAISAVIAVILPFIGIPLLIIGHWRAVVSFFQMLWSAVSGFFRQHWQLILTVLLPFIAIPLLIIRNWGAISGFFSRMWHDVSGFVSRLVGDVVGFFTRMFNDVTGLVTRLWHDVVGFVTNMWRDVTGWVTRLWHDEVAGFTNMWRDVTGWVSRLWRDVVGFVTNMWRDVTGWVTRIWRDDVALVTNLWRDVTGWVVRLWHDVVGFFTNLWHDVVAIWHALADALTTVARDTTRVVGDVFHVFWDALRTGFDAAKRAVSDIWDGIKHVVGAPVKVIVDVIYTHGIKAMWNAIIGKIPGVPDLPNVTMPGGWWAGGPIPGNSTRDDRLVPVAGGEHVWTSQEVRQAGGHEAVARMRSAVMGGQPVQNTPPPGSGYFFGGSIGGFPGSGVLSDIGHGAKDLGKGALGVVKDIGKGALSVGGEIFSGIGSVLAPLAGLVRGAMAALVEPAVHGMEGLADHLIGGKEGFSEILRDGVHQIGDAIINFVKGDDAAQAALAGGTPIDWNGGSDTIGLIESLARGIPSGNLMQVTSTFRPGGGSYHALHEAVDFSNGTDNTPAMLDFDRGWAAKYGGSLAELIHTAPGSVFIKDGKVVGPGVYSSVLAEHRNHVHVAISPASIARGHQIIAGMGGVGGLPTASSLAARQYAASILGRFGWGQDQMPPLTALWNRESNWDPNIVNKSSGAYGIPQALGKGHPYNLGDYVAQINWGLNYIKGRYGSPGAAEAHEQSAGWYQNGTNFVPHDGLAFLHRGERVVTAADNKNGIGGDTYNFDFTFNVQGGDAKELTNQIAGQVEDAMRQVVTRVRAGAGRRV